MRQAGQQPPPWHEQDEVDSTRVSKTSFCAVGKNDQYLSRFSYWSHTEIFKLLLVFNPYFIL